MKESDEQKNNLDAKNPDSETVSVSKEEYGSLLNRIQELEESKEKMLRTAAEFENAKKRLAKEREEYVRFSLENVIRGILPVLDNFERALAHAAEPADQQTKSIVVGIQMVFKQLSDVLKAQGLVRLETKDKKFDPHFHEAIGHVYEKGEEDIVVDEVEPGYLLHDRLLRAAKVRVRTAPVESNPVSEEKDEEIT